jgi:acid phosphatase
MAGISWKGYMEGMPGSDICNGNGSSDGGTDYIAHHNPFVYFGNTVNNSTRCSLVVPSGLSGGATSCGTSVTTSVISSLVIDLNGTAPNFSWVTPNVYDDSHDCSVQQASNWLSVVVPAILTTKTFETDASATVVITFDEPATGTYGTTPVYFVVAGPGAKLQYTSSTKFTHLNWLATIESNWSLSCLVSGNDCGSNVMSEFLRGAVAPPSPPSGFCLQCLLNNFSSSSLLLIGLAVGLTLATSAVILARRRNHPANPGARNVSLVVKEPPVPQRFSVAMR